MNVFKKDVVNTDIALAKKGNTEAFIRLIENNKYTLARIANGILKNNQDVEDAIQETIILSYKNIYKLRQEQYFKTWLIKILINECNKILKKRKNTIPLDDTELESEDDRLSNLSENLTLMNGINKLDDDYRVITILYYFENLSYKDIAELLNIPEGTVKSRLSRAREKLYNLLNEEMLCENECRGN